MPRAWRIALLILPGLLLTYGSIPADPINPTLLETHQEPEAVIKDESKLTRLEEGPTRLKEIEVMKNYTTTYSAEDDGPEVDRIGMVAPEIQGPPSQNSLGKINTSKWGSHPIGDGENFYLKENEEDFEWVAYFYDQVVVAVLQTKNRTMFQCTVQENIQDWEQRAALTHLSKFMSLQPIPFNVMVHLITLCGTINMPPRGRSKSQGFNPFWWVDPAALRGILPGTLWCGMKDRATYYHELGPKQLIDSCCRAHDHCPIKVSAKTTRYGVTNSDLNTVSHCTCDLEFFRCLKASRTDVADMIGKLYFNVMRVKCLTESNDSKKSKDTPFIEKDTRRPLMCTQYDHSNGCSSWVRTTNGYYPPLQITQLKLEF